MAWTWQVLELEIGLRELKFAFEEAMHHWTVVNEEAKNFPEGQDQQVNLACELPSL